MQVSIARDFRRRRLVDIGEQEGIEKPGPVIFLMLLRNTIPDIRGKSGAFLFRTAVKIHELGHVHIEVFHPETVVIVVDIAGAELARFRAGQPVPHDPHREIREIWAVGCYILAGRRTPCIEIIKL